MLRWRAEGRGIAAVRIVLICRLPFMPLAARAVLSPPRRMFLCGLTLLAGWVVGRSPSWAGWNAGGICLYGVYPRNGCVCRMGECRCALLPPLVVLLGFDSFLSPFSGFARCVGEKFLPARCARHQSRTKFASKLVFSRENQLWSKSEATMVGMILLVEGWKGGAQLRCGVAVAVLDSAYWDGAGAVS